MVHVSNCCEATIMPITGLCSNCKEHCDVVQTEVPCRTPLHNSKQDEQDNYFTEDR
ncbi:hypothetical protein KAR91_09290 [Candidatus Pacearchaeota archaeon]|nr:hypothetical protein [Candidatus Pacearchaeota archaeon]